MTAAELLRRAADTCEASAIGERKDRIIRLLALHIIRTCGEGENAEDGAAAAGIALGLAHSTNILRDYFGTSTASSCHVPPRLATKCRNSLRPNR